MKKLDQLNNQVKSYARLKFHKDAAFVSNSRPESLERGHNFAKSHPCLIEHNFSSIIDINLINTAIDRLSLDLSLHALQKCVAIFS